MKKRIDNCCWGKNDTELTPDIIQEFDKHIHFLTKDVNGSLFSIEQTWESTFVCLQHLSVENIKTVTDLLVFYDDE